MSAGAVLGTKRSDPRDYSTSIFGMARFAFAFAFLATTAQAFQYAAVVPRTRPPMMMSAATATTYPPVVLATKLKDTALSYVAAVYGAYASLSKPAQMIVVATSVIFTSFYLFTELRKRASLIETGGKCMDTGDEGECALYDEKVTKTPTWKIKLALNKLAMTNVLGDKLGGASPPDGYEWGKTF